MDEDSNSVETKLTEDPASSVDSAKAPETEKSAPLAKNLQKRPPHLD